MRSEMPQQRLDSDTAVDLAGCVTVVSVVVRDASADNRILLGVRSPANTSARHPGVLSTLTIRVPTGLFEAALREACGAEFVIPSLDQTFRFDQRFRKVLGGPEGFAHPSIFLVEALFARKLNLGDALVEGLIAADVTPIGIACANVEDPKGGSKPEVTVMLTYLVDLREGHDLLPTSTRSYRPISWVNGRDLKRAVKHHDALVLLPDANPFEVCLHGLCMTSAATLLAFDEALPEV